MYFPNVKEQYFIWFFWIVGLTTLAELEREDQISFIKKILIKKNNLQVSVTYYILPWKYSGKNYTVQALWFESTDPCPKKHGSSMVSRNAKRRFHLFHETMVSGLCFQLVDVKKVNSHCLKPYSIS